MSNFKFLKPIDKNLYEIINDAEKLYRDEYFEQCITQTRRFGEIVCKNVLGEKRTSEKTFDDMLATLKDSVSSSIIQEREFVEDLYFLKKEGNSSVHASNVKQDGVIALECLQRSFEIALNYSVYFKKTNIELLKKQYDIELLVTGKKTKKTLKEKYLEKKAVSTKNKTSYKKNKKNNMISYKKKTSFFIFFVILSTITSIILTLTIYLLSFVK